MTKGELLQALRGQRNEVNFEGSRLSGCTDVVSRALADSLEATLSEDEVVRFAVETSNFGNDGAGQLVWVLALRSELIELTAEVEKDPRTGEARALKITLRILALIGEQKGARIELRYRGRQQLVLEEAKVVLSDGKEIVGDETSPRGLCAFFASILAAGRAAVRG
jgi:hypothetical protein